MNLDRSVDSGSALFAGTSISLFLAGSIVILHHLLHGQEPLSALYSALGLWWLIVATAAGIAIHEAIHAAGWIVAGKMHPAEIRVGIDWRMLVPYAHPCRPITVRAYAAGVAAPAVVLGLFPALAGLVLGRGALSGWGAIFLALASSDLIVLFTLRGLSGNALVQDHPTKLGCKVVDPG